MAMNNITIENTRFIYNTNFSGDPSQDRFGDARRKANIVIPDPQMAEDLLNMGVKVRQTRPRPDDDPSTFEPTYFVSASLKYRDRLGNPVKYPPRVYTVSGDEQPVQLDEESVGIIDLIPVKNVNVILNPYTYNAAGDISLYIRTMYVEQRTEDDPWANRYGRKSPVEDDPF